jgi:alkylation response protein AidB-like acyl-CoA dehydrogenase
MMGRYGFSSEYDMECLVRATLVSTIYGGTSRSSAASSPRRSGSGMAVTPEGPS